MQTIQLTELIETNEEFFDAEIFEDGIPSEQAFGIFVISNSTGFAHIVAGDIPSEEAFGNVWLVAIRSGAFVRFAAKGRNYRLTVKRK